MLRSREGWEALSHDPYPGAEQQGPVAAADVHHLHKDGLSRTSAHGWGSGSVPAKKKKKPGFCQPGLQKSLNHTLQEAERLFWRKVSASSSVHILSATNICHCHRQGHRRTAISALCSYHEKSWRWDRSWEHESFHSEWNQQNHISEGTVRTV